MNSRKSLPLLFLISLLCVACTVLPAAPTTLSTSEEPAATTDTAPATTDTTAVTVTTAATTDTTAVTVTTAATTDTTVVTATTATTDTATTDTATAGTRTIVDAIGEEVTLPAMPEKVITLTEWDLDAVLALGVIPVGVTTSRGSSTPAHYLLDQIADVPVIGTLNQPNLETIAAAAPDVILCDSFMENIEELRQIAPVVVTKGETDTDWKLHLQLVATALNREAAAEEFLANYDAQVQELKEQLTDHADKTISIVRWMPEGPTYMLRDAFSSLVIADVGLQRPEAQQQEGRSTAGPLSLEQIQLLDGDWIFMGVLDPTANSTLLDDAMNSPLFQQLQAVQNDHVVLVDGSQWTSIGGPLAAMMVLDDVAAAMIGE